MPYGPERLRFGWPFIAHATCRWHAMHTPATQEQRRKELARHCAGVSREHACLLPGQAPLVADQPTHAAGSGRGGIGSEVFTFLVITVILGTVASANA